MDGLEYVLRKIFKVPFFMVAFLIYLPIYILDLLWNMIIEEKPVPVKVVSR